MTLPWQSSTKRWYVEQALASAQKRAKNSGSLVGTPFWSPTEALLMALVCREQTRHHRTAQMAEFVKSQVEGATNG